MIHAHLVSLLLLLQPDTVNGNRDEKPQTAEEQQAEAMAVEVARARISTALQSDHPLAEQIEILSEVNTRCEDPHYRAYAAYNIGALLIAEGSEDTNTLKDTVAWLQQADIVGASATLRARARYNIGHARYKLAHIKTTDTMQAADQGDLVATRNQLRSTLSGLIEAAGAFRSVSEIEPEYIQSIENLERVRREIKNLRDQIELLEDLIEQQKQQRQQQQQQAKESAERLNDLADQQQQEAQQNAQQSPPNAQEQTKDQADLNEQTNREQEQLDEMNPEQNEQLRTAQEQLERAQQAQQRAQEALSRGDQEQAAEHQMEAMEALRKAARALQESAQSQPQQQGEQAQPGADRDSQQAQNPDEAETNEGEGDQISEIAEMLLDKERREREARRVYRSTGRPVRVEKDW